MKRILKKVLLSLILVVVLTNFIVGPKVYAGNLLEEALDAMMGTVIGLLTKPFRAVALLIADAIDSLAGILAWSQGSIDESGNIVEGTFFSDKTLTPYDILFNKVALLDVNFFNIPEDGTVISNMRLAVAGWYYVMRNIAATILLCVLIYVGIRMAISTVASDKAAFKKMLVDWVCSLALIFLVQYIIIFTFAVNEALVKALAEAGGGADALVDAIENIKDIANDWLGMNSIPATIAYCMIIAQTIGLVFSYFNRMLKIAFLMIISPLITLTYSMDKMGDGKAQALNTWLKEFVYTVLLQSFHCIIYMAFIGMALSILDVGGNEENNLGGAILAVLCIKFTKDAEKILGKIFQFEGSTSEASIGAGMALSAVALSQAKNFGKGTRNAINGVRNFAGTAKEAARNARIDMIAMGTVMKSANSDNKVTYAQAREAAEAKVTEEEADAAEKKNAKSKKYNVPQDDAYNKEVASATEKLKQAGMSDELAKQTARREVAKKARETAKKNYRQKKLDGAPKFIKGAVGEISALKHVATQFKSTQLYKNMGNMAKATIAGGAGLALGSMTYGTKGDAFGAMMMGVAVGKGTNELLKSSSGTLASNVRQYVEGLGVIDKQETGELLNEVVRNAGKYGNDAVLDKEIDELLKFVESELKKTNLTPKQQASEAKKIRSSIKNTVQSEIKQNPNISPQDLLNKVMKNGIQSSGSTHFAQVMQSDGAQDAITNVGNERRKKEIYDLMQTSSNLGLDPHVFQQDVIKGMPAISTSSTSPPVSEVVDNVVSDVQAGKTDVFDPDAQEVQDMSDDECKMMASEMAAAVDAQQAADRELESASQEIIDKERTMLEELQKMQELVLSREIERMRGELEAYKASLYVASGKDYAVKYKTELATMQARMQGELEKKLAELETGRQTIDKQVVSLAADRVATYKAQIEGLK